MRNKRLMRLQQQMYAQAMKVQFKRLPQLIQGEQALSQVPAKLKDLGIKRLLVVTSAGFIKRGRLEYFFDGLLDAGIRSSLYAEVKPDPDISHVEAGYKIYRQNGCQAIVAIGGGSVIDCAKVIGARVVNPNKSVAQLKGGLQVRKRIPTLFAVPTTAGSGSEVSAGAVITDGDLLRKYPINDFALIPQYAVLDASLLLDLPAQMTAYSGMDALTHAVEAYINRYRSQKSADYALKAIELIFEALPKTYADGQNLAARRQMLLASHYAGIAFTTAYIGYVHAISHGLGGRYHLPHGLINAALLPKVLLAYGEEAASALAEIADFLGLAGHSQADKAHALIQKIDQLRCRLNLPSQLPLVRPADVKMLAAGAEKEGNPTYPVPEIWDREKFETVIQSIILQ